MSSYNPGLGIEPAKIGFKDLKWFCLFCLLLGSQDSLLDLMMELLYVKSNVTFGRPLGMFFFFLSFPKYVGFYSTDTWHIHAYNAIIGKRIFFIKSH